MATLKEHFFLSQPADGDVYVTMVSIDRNFDSVLAKYLIIFLKGSEFVGTLNQILESEGWAFEKINWRVLRKFLQMKELGADAGPINFRVDLQNLEESTDSDMVQETP
jgi:hypothetical protein